MWNGTFAALAALACTAGSSVANMHQEFLCSSHFCQFGLAKIGPVIEPWAVPWSPSALHIFIPTSALHISYDPPALGFPEPPNVSLRLISVRFPFFLGSDGRRSPRRVRVSFHIMVTSLQRVWSLADVSTDVRATLGSFSCLSAEPFVGTLVGGWGGGGGLGGGSGFGGGWGGVITSCRRPSWRSSWSCNIQHPTRAWCYAVALLLATSNTLLMLRCGTSSCNI